MSHKHEYSDSSTESDSCDYSHDENEATVQRQRAKLQQEARKDKSKSSNETAAKDSSKKEDDDNDQSVSDDSLEVIVVKKSLEKKCEKVVSGRRSKTPRERTKETKLTKMHKRSSRKMSRSKSKIFDNDESTVDRDDSPHKKGRSAVKEPVHTSGTPPEGDEVDERIIESRYRRDATDSTSQETVEQVIVTAMVHKDQMPDTPKATLETAKEVNYEDTLKKKTIETEGAKETSKDITTSDKNEMILPHKMDKQDSGEGVQEAMQENSRVSTEDIQDENEKVKETSDKTQGKFH